MASRRDSPELVVRHHLAEFHVLLARQLLRTETIMATIADLTAAATALVANDAALASEVQSLTVAVNTLISAFEALKTNPATSLSAEDQVALDAAITNVTSASADLATQTQALQTEQGTIPPTA